MELASKGLYLKLTADSSTVSEAEWLAEFEDVLTRHYQTVSIAMMYQECLDVQGDPDEGFAGGVSRGPSLDTELIDEEAPGPVHDIPLMERVSVGPSSFEAYEPHRYEGLLSLACDSKHLMPLPWETGFLQIVMGNPMSLNFPRPIQVPLPLEIDLKGWIPADDQHQVRASADKAPVRRSQTLWKDKLRNELVKHLMSWIPIVLAAGSSSKAGKMLQSAG